MAHGESARKKKVQKVSTFVFLYFLIFHIVWCFKITHRIEMERKTVLIYIKIKVSQFILFHQAIKYDIILSNTLPPLSI